MNTRQIICAAALLALAALGAQAQDTPPAPPGASAVSAPAMQPVTQRLKFAPGQVRRYKVIMDVNGTMGAAGAGMPLNNHMEMTLTQTVKDVRASDGAATLASRADMTAMTMNGQNVPISDEMKAQMQHVSTTVITPAGKTLSVQVDGGAASGMQSMDFSSMGLSQSGTSLPTGPVKVGDTWKSAADLAMMGMKLQTASTLTGVDTTVGGNVANVTQTLLGTFSPSATPNASLPVQMTGTMTGTGTMKFDLNAGEFVSQNSVATMKMTVTPQKSTDGAAPAAGSSPMKMQFQITSSMTRLGDAPAAP